MFNMLDVYIFGILKIFLGSYLLLGDDDEHKKNLIFGENELISSAQSIYQLNYRPFKSTVIFNVF